MPERTEDQSEHEGTPTIYGESPGSESAAAGGISGNELPPDDDTPTIYHAADEAEDKGSPGA